MDGALKKLTLFQGSTTLTLMVLCWLRCLRWGYGTEPNTVTRQVQMTLAGAVRVAQQ